MKILGILLLLFCAGYTYYLHRFIKRHEAEGTDSRQGQQALAFKNLGLVKKLALATIAAAITLIAYFVGRP